MTMPKATTKSTRNTGKPWTPQEVRELKQLAKENTPTRVIGLKLGRTPRAIQSKASEAGISLAPPNRSPYGQVKSGAASKGRGGSATKRRRSAKTTSARKRSR
jgi:hypothetical protein